MFWFMITVKVWKLLDIEYELVIYSRSILEGTRWPTVNCFNGFNEFGNHINI